MADENLNLEGKTKELEYFCTLLNNPNSPHDLRSKAENSLILFRKTNIFSPLLLHILGTSSYFKEKKNENNKKND